jgi:hypothetical protein
MSQLIAVVTYLATGEQWTVPAFTYRPSHSARIAAALHGRSTRVAEGGFTACDGCGRFVAVGDSTVSVNGRAIAVAVAQCDRAVNDLAGFAVTRPVAYVAATTLLVCPSCNGSAKRSQWVPELEAAAIRRLRRYA